MFKDDGTQTDFFNFKDYGIQTGLFKLKDNFDTHTDWLRLKAKYDEE